MNIDDARDAIFAQTLAWGYQPRQPPLYDWLVWVAFQALGVGVVPLTLVRYAVLGAAYAFLYASARRMLADPRLAAGAPFGLLLLVPIGWTVHEDLTQSVLALAACAATFHLLLRLEETGSAGRHLALGGAIGLGLLSKFTYVLFAAALLLSALSVPRFRTRLLDARALLALAVAGALILPYALWLAESGHALGRLYAEEVRVGSAPGYPLAALTGLYYVVRIALSYAGPLVLVLLALAPGVYARLPSAAEPAASAGRLLERFFLCALGLLGLAALGGQLEYLKLRWAIPAFFLLPLYAGWRLDRLPVDTRRLRRLASVLVAVEIVVLGGILVQVYAGTAFGKPYRLNTPYDAIARQLAAAGFGGGTIVAGTGPLGGNLRLAFPHSRLISLDMPDYLPPRPASAGGQCLVAWDRGGGAAVPPDVQALLRSALGVDLTGAETIRTAEAPYRHAPDRTHRVHFVAWPAGAGDCR